MLFRRLFLAAALAFLLSFPVRGQEVVLEQSFDGLPLEAEGRFGNVGGTDSGGRWGTFGVNGKAPRNQDKVGNGGSAVELVRGDGDGQQVLIGAFGPLLPAKRILFGFDILIPDQAGVSVFLGKGNDPAVGILINQRGGTITVWDNLNKKWVSLTGTVPVGEWVRVKMDCPADGDMYSVVILDASGAEVAKGDFPFDKSKVAEGGTNNIVVGPQSGGPIYFDNPSVHVEP